MSRELSRRAPHHVELATELLERELVAAALERMQPVIDAVLAELRLQMESIVTATVLGKVGRNPRAGKLGELKRCRVCGLSGARNVQALPPDHSREEHDRLRLRVKP